MKIEGTPDPILPEQRGESEDEASKKFKEEEFGLSEEERQARVEEEQRIQADLKRTRNLEHEESERRTTLAREEEERISQVWLNEVRTMNERGVGTIPENKEPEKETGSVIKPKETPKKSPWYSLKGMFGGKEKVPEKTLEPMQDLDIPTFVKKVGAQEPQKEAPLTIDEEKALTMWGADWRREIRSPEEAREKLKILSRREKVPMSGTADWENLYGWDKGKRIYKRVEIREGLRDLEDSREDLLYLESRLNRARSLPEKFIRTIFFEKNETEELEKEYQTTKERYEQLRAKYIGAKTHRFLKEKQKLAEMEIEETDKGDFEKLRGFWRRLGDANIESLLSARGVKIENKAGKFVARYASLRTAISLGLLGGGMAIGFGSAAGIAAIAGRRVMGGLGTTFGAYDLMAQFSEKKELEFNKDDLSKMGGDEILQKMAQYEIQFKLSGKRLVKDKNYALLRNEYLNRTRNSGSIIEAIVKLDDSIRSSERERLAKGEKKRRYKAAGIGLVSVGLFSSSDLAKMLAGKSEIAGAVQGTVTPETIKDSIDSGLVMPPNVLDDSIVTEGLISPDTLSEAQNIKVSPDSIAVLDTLKVVVDRTKDLVSSDTLHTEIIKEELVKVDDKYVGVVEKGGSVWQAAQELVKDKAITKEDFANAWSSPASMVELDSGQTIHISELGLTHVGDQVVYVPEANDVPAHFTVIDYANDTLHVGSNEDLGAAFDAVGKEKPIWLQKAIESSNEIPEAPPEIELPNISVETPNIPSEIDNFNLSQSIENPPEGILSEAETLKAAAEGNLDQGIAIKTQWSEVALIYDDHEHIATFRIINNFPNARLRAEAVNKAVSQVLKPNFTQIIETEFVDSMGKSMPSGSFGQRILADALPNQIAKAKEAAFQIATLRQAFDATEPNSKEWYYLRYLLRRMVGPTVFNSKITSLTDGAMPVSIFNPNIIP